MKLTLGISHKMYFGYHQTKEWCDQVAEILHIHPLMNCAESISLFTLPSAMTIVEAISSFSGTNMQVGIQNIAPDSQGPWTGENSPLMASEVGCKYAEIGHAERRNYFHENEDLIIQKIKVSLKNQLTPIICIGEKEKMAPKEAERFAIQEVESILSSLHEDAFSNELIFAWEPQWAIGAPRPASIDYIQEVCMALRTQLGKYNKNHSVIYGGSAGKNLLSQLWPYVDGLFLGRFAHDPSMMKIILDEAWAILTPNMGEKK
ncbi:triose-phosphate isomerase family protein [Providencia rettgeri]|uniref:triose-phosphate isomerase family protein n=1 Tax=Providencia rettgeri TaxID=587 RepID=UPI001FF89FB2|nr:triose-phosphate isomerase family protein [Providencia rettgeri]